MSRVVLLTVPSYLKTSAGSLTFTFDTKQKKIRFTRIYVAATDLTYFGIDPKVTELCSSPPGPISTGCQFQIGQSGVAGDLELISPGKHVDVRSDNGTVTVTFVTVNVNTVYNAILEIEVD